MECFCWISGRWLERNGIHHGCLNHGEQHTRDGRVATFVTRSRSRGSVVEFIRSWMQNIDYRATRLDRLDPFVRCAHPLETCFVHKWDIVPRRCVNREPLTMVIGADWNVDLNCPFISQRHGCVRLWGKNCYQMTLVVQNAQKNVFACSHYNIMCPGWSHGVGVATTYSLYDQRVTSRCLQRMQRRVIVRWLHVSPYESCSPNQIVQFCWFVCFHKSNGGWTVMTNQYPDRWGGGGSNLKYGENSDSKNDDSLLWWRFLFRSPRTVRGHKSTFQRSSELQSCEGYVHFMSDLYNVGTTT